MEHYSCAVPDLRGQRAAQEVTTKPSLRSRLVRLAMLAVLRPRLNKGTVAQWRRQYDQFAVRVPVPRGVRVQPVSTGVVHGEWVMPQGSEQAPVLYYLHGGGFLLGSARGYRAFAARLAIAAGARAFVLDYRLAPEHPFPAALDDALAGYRWLRASGVEPATLAVAGDSAGGGLVLSMLVALRGAGERLPAAGVCISPPADLSMQRPSFRSRSKLEVLVTPALQQAVRRSYVAGHDPTDPRLSPVYADLRGLPPMLIHLGTDEVLWDDVQALVARLRDAGVEVTLRVWEGLWHCFALVPLVPESRQAIREIGMFLRARLSAPPAPRAAAHDKPPLRN